MHCAYLTLDEVNQDLAGRLAAAAGVRLDALSLRDAAPHDLFDAVVYDLDFLPPEECHAVLARLRRGRPTTPVAIHSYRLSPRQKGVLRRRGVIVARRLSRALFVQLREAIVARRASRMID
jgi:hypothetical protein